MFPNFPLDKKVPKSAVFFSCEYCDYNTSHKSHYEKHLATKKHKRNSSKSFPCKSAKSAVFNFSCKKCKKIYKTRAGLWKHKKYNHLGTTKSVEKSNPQTVIQNITNNYNNIINVNLFLDEHCKNAQTLKDFVDSITLSLKDLNYTKENGYVEGISKILNNQLKDLNPTDRPIHATDAHRLKFMVKNEEGWVKDDGSQLDNVVVKTKFKLVHSLTDWEKANPDYNSKPEKLDVWQKSLSAISPPLDVKEKYNKIIKKKLAKLASIKEAMKSVKE